MGFLATVVAKIAQWLLSKGGAALLKWLGEKKRNYQRKKKINKEVKAVVNAVNKGKKELKNGAKRLSKEAEKELRDTTQRLNSGMFD